MSNRRERMQALRDTTKEYIKSEKARIENEVAVLEAVLEARTGGAGIQRSGAAVVAAVAQSSLAAYLRG